MKIKTKNQYVADTKADILINQTELRTKKEINTTTAIRFWIKIYPGEKTVNWCWENWVSLEKIETISHPVQKNQFRMHQRLVARPTTLKLQENREIAKSIGISEDFTRNSIAIVRINK